MGVGVTDQLNVRTQKRKGHPELLDKLRAGSAGLQKQLKPLSEARQREVERGGISQSKHGSHNVICVINELVRNPSPRSE
ncbi:MAG: hypothetical protein DMF29_06225 [Verrucomicrobia bacterium]|nr:MAG: hypothetical protein DMF29_06225 [Verrucomicrobiota bacterium]